MDIDRKYLLSITVSIFFLIWALFGPIDNTYFEFNQIFHESNFPKWVFNSIRIGLIVTSLALLFKQNLFLSITQLILGSLYLRIGVFYHSLWNYNTHVLLISLLLILSNLIQDAKKREKDLVLAISILFSLIYFQSALSKLSTSGVVWMTEGTSIYMHVHDLNSYLDKLIDGNIILFQLAAWLTVTGELLLAAMFIFKRTRVIAAILAIVFHLTIWASFGISFWHLWIFYPAILIDMNWLNRSSARATVNCN